MTLIDWIRDTYPTKLHDIIVFIIYFYRLRIIPHFLLHIPT